MASEFARRVGYFPDNIEKPLHSAMFADFRNLNVNTISPAGILYILSTHPNTAAEVEQLTGVNAQEISQRALTNIQRLYPGQVRVPEVTPDTNALLAKATEGKDLSSL